MGEYGQAALVLADDGVSSVYVTGLDQFVELDGQDVCVSPSNYPASAVP